MSTKPAWSTMGRTGPVRRFERLSVFACEGLIVIIDERPKYVGEYTAVLPDEMKKRMTALMQAYRNQTRSELPKWQRQQMDARRRGAEGVLQCIKEAKEMGDPSDPEVRAFWARHRKSSTSSLTQSKTDVAGYPALSPLPLGQFTGRTTEAGVQLHKPPRRKHKSIILE